jgi:hypothetical protein
MYYFGDMKTLLDWQKAGMETLNPFLKVPDTKTVFDWQKSGMGTLNSFIKDGYDEVHKAHQLCWEQGLLWMKNFQKMHADWMDLFLKEVDKMHSRFQQNLGTMEQHLSSNQKADQKTTSGTPEGGGKSK